MVSVDEDVGAVGGAVGPNEETAAGGVLLVEAPVDVVLRIIGGEHDRVVNPGVLDIEPAGHVAVHAVEGVVLVEEAAGGVLGQYDASQPGLNARPRAAGGGIRFASPGGADHRGQLLVGGALSAGADEILDQKGAGYEEHKDAGGESGGPPVQLLFHRTSRRFFIS